jgi:hypothetical protein
LLSDAVAPSRGQAEAEERLGTFGASVLWVKPGLNLTQAASEKMHESVLFARTVEQFL